MIEDIYQKDLLKLAAEARGAGRLPDAHASAEVDNPLCGDRIRIDVKVDGERVDAIGYEVKACVLCQASATLLGRHATGRSAAEVEDVRKAVLAMLKSKAEPPAGDWADYAAFLPVRRAKSRHDCVMLPFQALERALDDAGATGRGSSG